MSSDHHHHHQQQQQQLSVQEQLQEGEDQQGQQQQEEEEGQLGLQQQTDGPWQPWWFSREAAELQLGPTGLKLVQLMEQESPPQQQQQQEQQQRRQQQLQEQQRQQQQQQDQQQHQEQQQRQQESTAGEAEQQQQQQHALQEDQPVRQQHKQQQQQQTTMISASTTHTLGAKQSCHKAYPAVSAAGVGGGSGGGRIMGCKGALPPLPSSAVPALSSLTKVPPSPLVKWTLVQLLFGYCVLVRHYLGELLGRAGEAACKVLTIAPAVAPLANAGAAVADGGRRGGADAASRGSGSGGADTVADATAARQIAVAPGAAAGGGGGAPPESVSIALQQSMTACCSPAAGLGSAVAGEVQPLVRAATADVVLLLQLGRPSVLLAVHHVLLCLEEAVQEVKVQLEGYKTGAGAAAATAAVEQGDSKRRQQEQEEEGGGRSSITAAGTSSSFHTAAAVKRASAGGASSRASRVKARQPSSSSSSTKQEKQQLKQLSQGLKAALHKVRYLLSWTNEQPEGLWAALAAAVAAEQQQLYPAGDEAAASPGVSLVSPAPCGSAAGGRYQEPRVQSTIRSVGMGLRGRVVEVTEINREKGGGVILDGTVCAGVAADGKFMQHSVVTEIRMSARDGAVQKVRATWDEVPVEESEEQRQEEHGVKGEQERGNTSSLRGIDLYGLD